MILVRHGQSDFNVHFAETLQDPGIIDPHLTDLGRRQIETVAHFLRQGSHRVKLRKIIASPYTRTLQSAEILAKILGLPLSINPLIREHAHFACDIGTARSKLDQLWPEIDFGNLPECWWPDREDEETVDLRALDFRNMAARKPDWDQWLVVTHWGFIRSLTNHRVPNATLLHLDPTTPHQQGATLVSLPDI